MSQRRALVTGGSRGIGRAICETLANKGFTVGVTSRSLEVARDVAALLHVSHPTVRHSGIACDIEDTQSIHSACKSFMDAHGGVDVLVNCAGAGNRNGMTQGT
jgi:NAD(P)-dependent dehydrogenase (short-subunit alcohol dehydrogenase family)